MQDSEQETVHLKSSGVECSLTGVADDYIFNQVRRTKDFYEGDLLRTLHSLAPFPEDGYVVDIGANIGNHTVYFAKVLGSKVIALEPVPQNRQILETNIQINNLEDQVEVHEIAAWDAETTLTFRQQVPGNTGTYAADTDGELKFTAVPAASIIRDRRTSIIKIDVEGAEPNVIRGLLPHLAKVHPLIIAESHDAENTRQQRELLAPLGYSLVGILGKSDNLLWAAPLDTANKLTQELTALTTRLQSRLNQSQKQRDTKLLDQIRELTERTSQVFAVTEKEAHPGISDSNAFAESAQFRAADGLQVPPLEMANVDDYVFELQPSRTGYREKIRVGIASMPGRETTLAKVLHRIAPQVDEVFVYLNGMDSVPQACQNAPFNVRFFTGPDLGDRGKFMFLKDFIGYYLTVDDDIDYPRYHANSLVRGIEKYNRRAIVGWHGSIFKSNFENFYESESRKVLSFRHDREDDTHVHLLGTGTTGFHTDTIRVSRVDFELPNMADVFLALVARRQGVKMIVLAHKKGEAVPLETPDSISGMSLGKDRNSNNKHLDVSQIVSKIVKDYAPWPKLDKPYRQHNRSPRVSIIGRTNPSRWKKGGILKSVLLTQQMLVAHGCDVELIDIAEDDPYHLDSPDVIIVYVGDPERPDFSHVHEIVEHHAKQRVPILVNLSEDGHPQRTAEIRKVMSNWHQKYSGRVAMMTFSQNVDSKYEYHSFQDSIVTLPKTLTFPSGRLAEYENTSGIFVGDVAKLSDPRIVGDHVHQYIATVRSAVPEAKIFGIRQYNPRYKVPSGIDHVWPFMQPSELMQKLATVRLMVSFPKFATYEMLPVEAAALGVPILYQDMPQSLNEGLGLSGIRYKDSHELASSVEMLYRDPLVWRQFSKSGVQRARSQGFDVASAQLYLRIKNFIERTRI